MLLFLNVSFVFHHHLVNMQQALSFWCALTRLRIKIQCEIIIDQLVENLGESHVYLQCVKSENVFL